MNNTGYVDEKSSTLVWKPLNLSYIDRWKQWLAQVLEKEPRWEELKDDKERVRFLYRHFLLRSIGSGYSYKSFFTPKETGLDVQEWMKQQGYNEQNEKDTQNTQNVQNEQDKQNTQNEHNEHNEQSPEQLILLYNQARYSNQPIDTQDMHKLAEAFALRTKKPGFRTKKPPLY